MKKTLTFVLSLFFIFSIHAQSITGIVDSIDTEHGTFDILIAQPEGSNQEERHTVRVSTGDLSLDYLNKQVRGTLEKSDGVVWLNKIWPVDPEKEVIMKSVNQVLHADTSVKLRRKHRKEGDVGINFAMINEQAEYVQFDQYKGKWIIMNFIFTRCRMPEMCPAQTARMVSLQKMAKKAGISNLQQLSVSFDPKYDTPGILNQYASMKGADTKTFSFLTGDYDAMLDLLKQYGVIAYESKNIIDHTVTTLLFNPQGKIVLRRDGTKWKESDFIKRIQHN